MESLLLNTISIIENAYKKNSVRVENVKVDPIVVFQILDGFLRRSENQDRVIGTLLGKKQMDVGTNTVVVTITHCFCVEHSISEDDVISMGVDMHRKLAQFHAKVNPNEKVVGWFSTSIDNGVLVNEHSSILQKFYMEECDLPVHVVVDMSFQQEDISLCAFVSAPEVISDVSSVLISEFTQVPLTMSASETTDMAIKLMKENRTDQWTDLEATGVSKLPDNSELLQESMKKLCDMVDQAARYTESVVNGKVDMDPKVGRELANAMECIPKLPENIVDQVLHNGLQDLLMVNYLSSLTQAQVAISEKLLHVKNNTSTTK